MSNRLIFAIMLLFFFLQHIGYAGLKDYPDNPRNITLELDTAVGTKVTEITYLYEDGTKPEGPPPYNISGNGSPYFSTTIELGPRLDDPILNLMNSRLWIVVNQPLQAGSYQTIVKVTWPERGNIHSKELTINITVNPDPNNNAPEFTEGSSTNRSVAENTVSGQNIGAAISATDADNDTLTYTLSGTDAAAFSIVSTTGQLQTKAALDYENKASYTVTVEVSDRSGGSDSITVTISVTDVDERPPNNAPVFTDGSSTSRSVAENTASGQNIGAAVSATDADNDTLTYTLGGTDAAAFSIVSTTGQLRTKAALDYENKKSYTVTVGVSDGNGGSDSIAVTISVTDVDERPPNNAPIFTDGTSTSRSVAENTASGQNIGAAISATDADNDTLTYTLSGTDAAAFRIVSTTGQLRTNAPLDYENKKSYTVTVEVSDGRGGSDSITVTISVTDVDETPNNAPVFTEGTSTSRSVAENTASGQNIGSPVSATDADNDTLTYTLGGTDAAAFSIVSSTGQLQTNAALDYENKASYTVTVSVSDSNGGSDSINVTINVTDVNENRAPVFTDGDSTTRTIAENTPSGQNIGSPISATDADAGDTLTYTLGGTDAAAFSIVSSTGQLQTNAPLDYENKKSYTVTVGVSDSNGGSDSINVTINVTDVNENRAPVFTDGDSTTRTIAENTPSGQNIGSPVSATDADNDTLTYTLSGTDAAAFSIVSSTGQLQTNAALDYENKASYTVTVSVSDGNGGSDSITVTISVTDVDETPPSQDPPPQDPPPNNPPVFTDGTSTTRTIAENTVSGQNIGSPISATDADNDPLTYTLSGTDAAVFRIVSTSGQLQTNAALDYETKASYTVTVSVSDGNGGSDTIAVTISVTDVDETPPPPVQQPPPTEQPVQQPPPPQQSTYTAVKGAAGQIVVSEIMFEYLERYRSIPQWIELYNTTNTAINIRGWQLEWYRREPKLLDATITFATDFTIPAKAARLICSTTGRNSGHEGMRVIDQINGEIYILFRHHSATLDQDGLQNRNRLITRGGFYLKLRDGEDTLIDEIGTVTDKASEPAWEFPDCNIEGARSSLIRRVDNGMPRSGIERNGWIRAYDTKARPTGRYYGRQTDVGSPAYHSEVRPLPVTLSSFRAEYTDASVLIKWITESEIDNAGFYLYRSETEAGAFKVVNAKLIQGAGTSSERNTYTWTDTTAKPNTFYYYRIEDVSHAGVQKQLATVRLRGFVSAKDKLVIRWADIRK